VKTLVGYTEPFLFIRISLSLHHFIFIPLMGKPFSTKESYLKKKGSVILPSFFVYREGFQSTRSFIS
jgi:hypothetical protein